MYFVRCNTFFFLGFFFKFEIFSFTIYFVNFQKTHEQILFSKERINSDRLNFKLLRERSRMVCTQTAILSDMFPIGIFFMCRYFKNIGTIVYGRVIQWSPISGLIGRQKYSINGIFKQQNNYFSHVRSYVSKCRSRKSKNATFSLTI